MNLEKLIEEERKRKKQIYKNSEKILKYVSCMGCIGGGILAYKFEKSILSVICGIGWGFFISAGIGLYIANKYEKYALKKLKKELYNEWKL